MTSFLLTTLFVVGVVTLAAWWFADQQTRARVELRFATIGKSLAGANYPLTPTVLRAVSELTDTELILLDDSKHHPRYNTHRNGFTARGCE